MYSADSLLQPLQILLIRMGQCTVKIGNQHIQIRSRIRLFFHFLIPLPHGQGHFALAHKCANHLIAGIQIFLHAQQNFLKIRSTSAKSGGTKQKNLFVLYGFQQFQAGGICRTLIGPKADKQYRRRRHTALVISKMSQPAAGSACAMACASIFVLPV